MLIPSIDLQGGRIVQLVQGERLALASDDVDGWIARFRGRAAVQLIDLDAARGEGANDGLVRRICGELPCRVGGGIRSVERAEATLALGATHVIVGSALFDERGVNLAFAERLAARVARERLIAAVDSRHGHVVIHGWRTELALAPADAVGQLEPFVGGFLYTHVDREGLMQGTDLRAIEAIAAATTRRVTAAGGITTRQEIEHLDRLGIDAVVGMALYTGKLAIGDAGT
jgi:phosphoribosylformimino-5-aminoimidazole carboxamide ribotide isomerase